MFYQQELAFLCEIFNKNNVRAAIFSATELKTGSFGEKLQSDFESAPFLRELFSSLEPRTLYHGSDRFDCHYTFLILPETPEPTFLCLGPYLTQKIGKRRLVQLAKANGVSAEKQRYLFEYLSGFAVLEEGNPLQVTIHAFCERIWRNKTFVVKDLSKTHAAIESPFSRALVGTSPDDALINVRALEQRYAFENEMMRSVSLGLTQRQNRFSAAFSDGVIEQRTNNPTRNVKNYGVIMNTLLRKAAERGGVHPVYIDRVSSDFAVKIETATSTEEVSATMSEMFETYCRLVKEHAEDKLTGLVQQAVLIIESDLAADLSAGTLAKCLCVSLPYLCSAFKQATGKTVSEYVRQKRMDYAAYLLSSTNLQIQNVAFHCGVMDMQYFSKLFKAHHGKTPTEYRNATSKAPNF